LRREQINPGQLISSRDSRVESSDEAAPKPDLPLVALDAPAEAEGLNFSIGQQLLVAHARALLRDTKIVMVDKGTSSVDAEIDAHVQETLATGLWGKTLISIAHILRTVIKCDRICIMHQGKIVELDSPREVWQLGDVSRGMCESNGVAAHMILDY